MIHWLHINKLFYFFKRCNFFSHCVLSRLPMRGIKLKTVLLFVDNYFSYLKILWLSLDLRVLSYHCYGKICGTFPSICLALYGSIISHVFIQFGEVLFYYYLEQLFSYSSQFTQISLSWKRIVNFWIQNPEILDLDSPVLRIFSYSVVYTTSKFSASMRYFLPFFNFLTILSVPILSYVFIFNPN